MSKKNLFTIFLLFAGRFLKFTQVLKEKKKCMNTYSQDPGSGLAKFWSRIRVNLIRTTATWAPSPTFHRQDVRVEDQGQFTEMNDGYGFTYLSPGQDVRVRSVRAVRLYSYQLRKSIDMTGLASNSIAAEYSQEKCNSFVFKNLIN